VVWILRQVCYLVTFSLVLSCAQYLEGCIERTPDINLSELKEELEDVCGVKVSESTIQHALHHHGFTPFSPNTG
jgi:hypothetical protein